MPGRLRVTRPDVPGSGRELVGLDEPVAGLHAVEGARVRGEIVDGGQDLAIDEQGEIVAERGAFDLGATLALEL